MADKKPIKFRSKGKAAPFMTDLKRLIDVPVRLWKPAGKEGAVRVRSCAITPPLKISLQDVLDRKHLPPLSLTDFEDYLKYEERSPENLYFIQWLYDYTAAYEKNTQLKDPNTTVRPLALSWARAKATFFSEMSPMALNLPDKVVPKSTSIHPEPSVLDGAKHEAEHMLRESLNRFISTTAQGNVEPIAMVSAGVFAATSTFLALAPLLVQILGGRGPKGLRAVSIPLLFMGISVALTTLHGVCFITWLLGDARQKREYEMELLPPSISSPTPQTMSYLSSLQATTMDNGDSLNKLELGFPDPELLDPLEKALFFYTPYFAIDDNTVKSPTTAVQLLPSSNSIASDDRDADTIKVKPTDLTIGSLNYQDLAMPNSPGPTLTSPTSGGSVMGSSTANPFAWSDTATTRFDSVYSPSTLYGARPQRTRCSRKPIYPSVSRAHTFITRVFAFAGPLEKIESPVILRSNWEVVMRSMAIGMVAACTIFGALWAVPTRH